ncbi:MAG TPA: hypothetical protein VG650_02595 [Mycobacteriales bacterium]|nr:hypothetical protein [Mycobacteriales bacterium]
MTLLARSFLGAVALAVLVSGGVAGAVPGQTAGRSVRHLPGTSCTAFPANNVWHADIAALPVDPHSAQWVRDIGDVNLHPDFGPSYGAQPVPYGIPITYVSGAHPKVRVKFLYSSESDHVGYPLGSDTKIEGGSNADGDRHAIVVDRKTCRLYEVYDARHTSQGWTGGSGATWSLDGNKLRPAGWTSADAAGLPIMPGLLRYDEVAAGHVDHAIRFTAPRTARKYIWPARHEAGSESYPAYPPMGARFRLKASYSPPASFGKAARVVVQAMKTYGLILADNGSPWYFQGEASTKWSDKMIADLKGIPGSAFEAVDESSLEVSSSSARTS